MLIPVALVLLAFAAGCLAYLYFEGLGPKGRWFAALRGTTGALVVLLLLDLTCARPGGVGRPLVLLDGSLSMDAAGGQGGAARDSAALWGEVRPFGSYATGTTAAPDFGRSNLGPALRGAAALERPVIIVTDGAIADLGELPPDLLARATIRLFPRDTIADLAILRVDALERVTLGDTVRVAVTVGRSGGIGANSVLQLRDARGNILVRRDLALGASGGEMTLALPTRVLGVGEHLLSVAVVGSGDAEPRDDARAFLVRVTQLPGAVLLASPPDWDARQLYATLRDVAALPVKGYARYGAMGWRSMDDLHRVTPDEVARAARGSDLLIVKGEADQAIRGARPRGLWRWPSGEGGETQLAGDWYVTVPSTPSPLAGAWAGFTPDTLPPLSRVTPVEPAPREWIGLSAQLGRRGGERPVILGMDSAGLRVLQTTGDGLWRWAFRPGRGEELYRQIVAGSVNWLLGAADTLVGGARPVRRVVPFGLPVVFERTVGNDRPALRVTVSGDSATRIDTLTFDGSGRAELLLPPGRYSYQLDGGGRGVVAVDHWSEEFVPKGSGLRPQSSGAVTTVARSALRDQWWLYALVVVLLSAEWWMRRRAGLR